MSETSNAAAILITGAASGIGRATAELFSRQDQALILIDRDEAGLNLLEASLPGPVQTHAMDVSDANAWATLQAHPTPLNGAVICAGLSRAAPITEMTFGDWRTVLSVNLDGAFLALQSSLRTLVDGGSIAVISSATARKAAPKTAAYGASKAGLEQLVRVAALEAAPRRIRVNAVAPGGVKTPMFSDQAFFGDLIQQTGSEEAAWSALAADVPLASFAEPGEVAAMAAWLLSDETRLMTGTVVDIDGGYGL